MKETIKKVVKHDFVKFAIVGVVSTVIDMILLKIVNTIGWPYWLALAIGFGAGTINGYFMNSRWTFKYDTSGKESIKFTQFVIVSFVGFCLTELIGNIYIGYFGHDLSALGLTIGPKMVGKIIAVIIVLFWNYFANKHWTFRKQSN